MTEIKESSAPRIAKREHQWITVINPTNSRLLLQACDNCGVVKSENSVFRGCSKPSDQHLISTAMAEKLRLTA